jgi:Micrococcal nuclease (thermonuclease) homologs
MSVSTCILIAVNAEDRSFSPVWGWRGVLAGLVLLLWGPVLAQGQSYVGKGHRVLDGDTIHLLRETGQIVRVELYGVDAPERGQPFADAATRVVRRVVFRTEVQARAETDDPDGRSVFVVRVDDRVLNEHLLRNGLAWWDREQAPYNDQYRRLEQQARANERGLWVQSKPVPPWTWRGEEGP